MQVPKSGLGADMERMSRALEQLSEAASLADAVNAVLRLAVAGLAMDGASVSWWDAAGPLRTQTLPALPEEAVSTLARRFLETASEGPSAVLSLEAAPWGAASREALGMNALLALPFPAASPDARVEGVLMVFSRVPRAFSMEDVRRGEVYARLARLALERESLREAARLYQSEREARLRAEEAGRRLGQLAEAHAALARENAELLRQAREAEEESRRSAARLHVLAQVSQLVAEAGLDLDSVLDVVVRKVSEALGEACMLRLLSEDGQWQEQEVVYHEDAEARALLEAAVRARPRGADEGLVGRAVSLGQTLFLPRLTVDEVREGAPEYLPYVERYGPQSLIAVPLVAWGRPLGELLVLREAQQRTYRTEEKVLLESLASRVALAIEDARLYGAATQAVRARDDLLSVAGHELKTPLQALQLHLQLLVRTARGGGETMGLVERAERALRSSERLRLLLDDLLDVSRVQAGQLKLRRETVELDALVREGLARMSEELARAGCELTLRAEPVCGEWDRLRLEQVISNLLSNAVKYGAGHPLEVGVAALDAAWARVWVKDGGIGIAPEDQERIFERFTRGSGVGHIHGLGLGLWITRRMVEAHGGRIRVESAAGQGSTFIVELPLGGAASSEGSSGRNPPAL